MGNNSSKITVKGFNFQTILNKNIIFVSWEFAVKHWTKNTNLTILFYFRDGTIRTQTSGPYSSWRSFSCFSIYYRTQNPVQLDVIGFIWCFSYPNAAVFINFRSLSHNVQHFNSISAIEKNLFLFHLCKFQYFSIPCSGSCQTITVLLIKYSKHI